jgi:hypothetical protein
MDTLAVPWCSSPLYQHGVSPNKIFDYMFAARPIVQASDASNDLVAQACCGITVRPADPWAFLQAIEAIRAMPLEDRTRRGTNGRGFVCRHHDIRMLAEQFLLTVAAPKSGRVKFRDGGREETSMEPSAEAVGDLEYLTGTKGLRRSVE